MRTGLAAAVLLLSGGGVAAAAEVSRDATIDASPAKVWAAIGPFCSIADWHPAIAKCEEKKAKDGTLRHLTTQDGGKFDEKLLSHDDKRMRYSYSILKSPLPVTGYSSTLSVAETAGKSHVTWVSTFEPKGASEAEAEKVVGGIYEAGLAALKDKVR